jgi:hypothetical protein
MHVQPHVEEFFWVLSGEATARIDDPSLREGPGGFVFVPRGAAHGFGVPGPAEARIPTAATPPGPEKYFEGFARATSRDPMTIAALRVKHHLKDLGRPVL